MSKLDVLLSCMYQNDNEIIATSNLQGVSTIIVNQTNVKEDKYTKLDDKHLWIDTKTRGLSNSRNMAIKNSSKEICLLSDDDEVFVDDLEQKIVSAYEEVVDADVIVFNMLNRPNVFGDKVRMLKKYEILKVSSWQISFKRSSISDHIFFDNNLGAGNGAGEENKFLFDCHKAGLKIYYYPVQIASVAQESSTWFFGYDKDYFYKRGMTTRYILGGWLSIAYALYFVCTKKNIYDKDISPVYALKYILKGILDNKITRDK